MIFRMPWPRRRRGESNGTAAAGVASPPPALDPRAPSPLNESIWRLSLAAAGSGAAAFAATRVLGNGNAVGALVAAALLAWGGVAASRLLLTGARAPRFWRAWLLLSLLPLALSAAWIPSLLLIGVFLVFRRYGFLRHLTSRRRAWLFLIALLVLPLTVAGWVFPEAKQLGSVHAFAQAALRCLLGAHQVFWVMAAIHLVLGMRLHFMRLKPKLAASAVLVALVPLLLVILLWVVILFSALGASRSSAGRGILQDWVALAGRDPEAGRLLFDGTFARTPEGTVAGAAPIWLAPLLQALDHPGEPVPGLPVAASDTSAHAAPRRDRRGRVVFDLDGQDAGAGRGGHDLAAAHWTVADTTMLLRVADQLWAVALEGDPQRGWSVRGCLVGERSLRHLAEVLRADVSLYSGEDLVIDRAEGAAPDTALADTTRLALRIAGSFARPDSVASRRGFWQSRLGFGASLLPVIRLGARGLVRDEVLLGLLITPADLARELWSRDNETNRVIIVALITLAVLLLGIEAFAVLMGVRVVGGITGAVRSLHQGTQRLAQGDLETRIEVPNEDELGDLAQSFNEMTAAVRKGREEAVARERLERELRTAREIQDRLLPHEMPVVPGYEITGVSVPSLQVGGDYFDFLDLPGERLGIAVADVSGKGIPAALLMANLQALLRGQVIHAQSVSETVSRMNDLLVGSTDMGRFATLFYGVLERATGAFTYTNAGHNPPLLRRAGGSVEELRTGGLLLGMLPSRSYRQETVELRAGDTLVLYTDGITEAEGPVAPPPQARPQVAEGADDEEEPDLPVNHFGEERLRAVVDQAAARGAPAVREAVLGAVREHAAGVPPSDDITLVVIRRLA